jgi:hypothetical protein
VLGGVGIAGLAVSAITGALVLSKKRTVQDECVNHHCTQAGLDAGDSGRTLATVSTVAFIAGAASLGAAFVLVLTDKRGHETTLEPRALRDGGGVELRGRF